MNSKKTVKYLILLAAICIFNLQPAYANDIIFYGANAYYQQDIVELNPTQGTAIIVGGLAFQTQAADQDSETGYVYYFKSYHEGGDAFAYWDPETGGNHIVRTYANGGVMKGMDFAPDGTLYMMDDYDGLYTIDKQTGDTIFLGEVSGIETDSLGRTGDFVFAPDGTLYLVTYKSLYTIDLNTLESTLLYTDMISGPQAIQVWTGLAYCGGMLYASDIEADYVDDPYKHSTIYSIDPATGEVTELFPSPSFLNDLTSCIDPILNHSPLLDPIGAQAVTEEELLEFVVTASDPDVGDTLTFSADNVPAGADFDPETRTFSWAPVYGDAGNYTVTFTVTDDGAPPRSDSEDVTISVYPSAPTTTLELKGANDTEDTVIADGTYAQINFGGSADTLAVGVLPAGIITRGLIRWDLSLIPPGSRIVSAQMSLYSDDSYGGYIAIDAHRALQSWVEGTLDGQRRQYDNPDSSCWSEYGYGTEWEILGADGAADRAATVISWASGNGIGWYVWDIKEAVQKWVDGDWANDGLILKADNESTTNLKFFVPSENQDGTLRPTLVIQYEESSTVNYPPVLGSIGDKAVTEESLLEFVITASDPDVGDSLTMWAEGLPAGASFDAGSGTFSWIPDIGDAGQYTVTFTVEDDGTPAMSDSEAVSITVASLPVNYPPVLGSIGDKAVTEESLLEFVITASDPDVGDSLTMWAEGLPAGASFDAGSGTFSWIPDIGDAGQYTVTFTVEDDGTPAMSDSEAVSITVASLPVNHSPVLGSIGDKAVTEESLLEFVITASDPDVGDSLAMWAEGLPAGASFDAGSGTFSWTPDIGAAGQYTVTFTVEDDGTPAMSDSEAVSITVASLPVNHPPVLGSIGDKAVTEESLLEFVITASDPDVGDSLAMWAEGLPAGASFDAGSGTFSWTPDIGAAGQYTVTFTVEDDGTPAMSDSEAVSITVASLPVNHPPVLGSIGDKAVTEESLLEFVITASDPDVGDSLTMWAEGLPAGASFDAGSGTFSWTPDIGAAGQYTVTFTVEDDGTPAMSDSEAVTITVASLPVNHPPVLGSIGDKAVTEEGLLEFVITASDPDVGDSLAMWAEGLPAGASFDAGSGTFSWIPDIGDAGQYTVTFTVEDDGTPAMSDSEAVTITVDPPSPPITIELQGTSDTEDTIIADGSYSLLNFGGSDDVFAAGVGSSGVIVRALINWDLSSIPPGSTIVSAQMSLYVYDYYPGGNLTIDAHRMLKSWVEGTLDGQGRQLDNPDSSCWSESGYGAAWDEPGANGAADRAATIIGSTTDAGTGWYSWSLKQAVQAWVNGDWGNDGLILKSNNESTGGFVYFAPSESQYTDYRPTLTIEYVQP